MMKINAKTGKSHLIMLYEYLVKSFDENRMHFYHLDGVTVVGTITAIFENMHGLIDNEFE